MIRQLKAAEWALAIFLAGAFVLVGISKLGGPSAIRWAGRFALWGYPSKAQYMIGVFEILGGFGVLFPRLRRAAAAILVCVMIGALCTHAIHGELSRVVPPLVLGGLASLLMVAVNPRRARTHPGADRSITGVVR